MIILKIIKALADETRLRLFNVLMHHEFNVNELVEVMDMGQSRISRHLKILTDCGLLSSRRDGSYVYYHAVINEDNRHLAQFLHGYIKGYEKFNSDLQRAEEIIQVRKNRTRNFFNTVALYWDRLKSEVFGEFDIGEVVKDKVSPCRVLVDLGCGTGELLLELQNLADSLIGVDSSPRMLEQAGTRLTSNGVSVDLRLGEMEHLPMSNEEAGCAVINMVLHYLTVPASGIREAARILKSSGRLIITDFDKHNNTEVKEKYGGVWLGFDKEEIGKWLDEAGLILKEIEQYEVHHNLKVNVFVAEKK